MRDTEAPAWLSSTAQLTGATDWNDRAALSVKGLLQGQNMPQPEPHQMFIHSCLKCISNFTVHVPSTCLVPPLWFFLRWRLLHRWFFEEVIPLKNIYVEVQHINILDLPRKCWYTSSPLPGRLLWFHLDRCVGWMGWWKMGQGSTHSLLVVYKRLGFTLSLTLQN